MAQEMDQVTCFPIEKYMIGTIIASVTNKTLLVLTVVQWPSEDQRDELEGDCTQVRKLKITAYNN